MLYESGITSAQSIEVRLLIILENGGTDPTESNDFY